MGYSGFEPLTPALSRRCSKPTELISQKNKNNIFFEINNKLVLSLSQELGKTWKMKKNKAKYIELIEKFENGELSEKEKESFLKELQSNQELRSELKLNKKIIQAICDDKLDEFKELLDKAHKKSESEN